MAPWLFLLEAEDPKEERQMGEEEEEEAAAAAAAAEGAAMMPEFSGFKRKRVHWADELETVPSPLNPRKVAMTCMLSCPTSV